MALFLISGYSGKNVDTNYDNNNNNNNNNNKNNNNNNNKQYNILINKSIKLITYVTLQHTIQKEEIEKRSMNEFEKKVIIT